MLNRHHHSVVEVRVLSRQEVGGVVDRAQSATFLCLVMIIMTLGVAPDYTFLSHLSLLFRFSFSFFLWFYFIFHYYRFFFMHFTFSFVLFCFAFCLTFFYTGVFYHSCPLSSKPRTTESADAVFALCVYG